MSKQETTFTHDWIWRAIDTLASRHGLSASGLAKLAGLDPTTFNRSKRVTPEGRPRWPSTESISKILDATGTALDEFATLELSADEVSAEADSEPMARVPILGEMRDAIVEHLAVELSSIRQGRKLSGPTHARHSKFAVLVADSSLEPVYSQGNTLIVSITEAARAGHRVVIKPTNGQARAGVLLRMTKSHLELSSFKPGAEHIELPRNEVEWIGRIIWARQ